MIRTLNLFAAALVLAGVVAPDVAFAQAGRRPGGGGGGQRPAPAPARPAPAPRPSFVPQPRPTPQPQFVRPNPQPQVYRPQQPQVVRPNAVPQPVIRPNPITTPRPNVVTPRPSFVPQPNVVNRPGYPATVNRPQFNPNHVTNNVYNRPGGPVVTNRPNVTNNYYRPPYNNRPGYAYGNGYRPGYNYGNAYGAGYRNPYYRSYYPYYSGWYRGAWNGWGYRPPFYGYGYGYNAGWLGGTTVVYANPYYVAPAFVGNGLNYSTPIYVPDTAPTAVPVPADAAPSPTFTPPPALGEVRSSNEADPKAREAAPLFQAARDAFRGGDYAGAQGFAERAIAANPNDPALHEFRALALFARGQYRDAAATLNAVLASAPGWTWDTLSSCYGDAAAYERQIRALEAAVQANPNDAAVNFVLAYHSLVVEQYDTAKLYLQRVVGLQPNDKVAAQILDALNKPPQGGEQPR